MQPTPLDSFVDTFSQIKRFWMLTDTDGQWATVESARFVDTDVIPVWDDKQLAELACVDDWQNFRPRMVKLSEWFGVWLPQLNAADLLVGITRQNADVNEQNDVMTEYELTDFTAAIVKALGAD